VITADMENPPSAYQFTKDFIAERGFRGLYAGFGFFCLSVIIGSVITFSADRIISKLKRELNDGNWR
jgi:hypothetical protein